MTADKQRGRWRPNPFHLAALILGEVGLPAPPPLVAHDDGAQWRALVRNAFDVDVPQVLGAAPSADPNLYYLLDRFSDAELPPTRYATVEQALADALNLCPVAWRASLESTWKAADEKFRGGLRRVARLLVDTEDTPDFTNAPLPDSVGYYETSIAPLLIEGASFDDPNQGPWRDCWLIASMSAVAWADRAGLSSLLGGIKVKGSDPPSIDWRFHDQRRARRVETDLPRSADKSRIGLHAYSATSPELWPALIEKAWAMRMAGQMNDAGVQLPSVDDYKRLDHAAMPNRALRALTGRPYQEYSSQRLTKLQGQCRFGEAPSVAIAASTDTGESAAALLGTYGLAANHCYAVLGRAHGQDADYVVLRDPHGTPFTTAVQIGIESAAFAAPDGERQVWIGARGIRAIREADFERAFTDISLPTAIGGP